MIAWMSSPFHPPPRVRSLVALVPLAAACLGCDDLDRFTTAPGEAYCGAITLAGAFRTGFSPRVQMRLTLDATRLDGPESPGQISTFEAPDETHAERRLLDAAPLRLIPPMLHDPLSRLEFGDGRERNAVYAVSPSALDAESILAIVSLRSDETVEVRLVRGGTTGTEGNAPPEGRRPLFGIFPLRRKDNACGF
jgi:hypothetical protein